MAPAPAVAADAVVLPTNTEPDDMMLFTFELLPVIVPNVTLDEVAMFCGVLSVIFPLVLLTFIWLVVPLIPVAV